MRNVAEPIRRRGGDTRVLGLELLHHREVAGAGRDQALGQVKRPVAVPDVLGQHQDRVRRAEVQQLGPAGAHLAETDLALARAGEPAQLVVERGQQGGAAVVLDLKGSGGAPAEADGLGGDVFLQLGNSLAVPDQDGFPEPAFGSWVDADAGGDELGSGLAYCLGAFDLERLAGTGEDLLEGADAFDADAGEGVRDEASDAAPGPNQPVLLQEHEGFADHGAADLHVGAEFGLGGDHGARGEEAVADGLGDARVHGHAQRRAGLGGHRLGQEPGGVLVHV